VPVHRPFPAPPGRREITGRWSGRNAHPAEPPGTKDEMRGNKRVCERRAAGSLDRVARSARGCAQDAAAHDRKPGGARNFSTRQRRRSRHVNSFAPCLRALEPVTFSLRVGTTPPHTASTSTNTHTDRRTTPHAPHQLPPSRTTNRTTRRRCGRRQSLTASGFIGSATSAHATVQRPDPPAWPPAVMPMCVMRRTLCGARPRARRFGHVRHLIEQPMLGRCGSGTGSPAKVRRIASASSSPVTGSPLPGVESSNAPR
jgi:hypothetical protein